MQYAAELLLWMLVVGLTSFISTFLGVIAGVAHTDMKLKENLKKYKEDYLDAMYGVPRNG